jgi:ankyrin repeat protein
MFAASAPTEAQTRSITVTAARRTDTAAALRQAAEAGDMDALQALLSGHTDSEPPSQIDARDGNGRTALMLATLHGRGPAVEALLAAGADPNAADEQGTTPLQAAIAGGQPDIIAALQRGGAH